METVFFETMLDLISHAESRHQICISRSQPLPHTASRQIEGPFYAIHPNPTFLQMGDMELFRHAASIKTRRKRNHRNIMSAISYCSCSSISGDTPTTVHTVRDRISNNGEMTFYHAQFSYTTLGKLLKRLSLDVSLSFHVSNLIKIGITTHSTLGRTNRVRY